MAAADAVGDAALARWMTLEIPTAIVTDARRAAGAGSTAPAPLEFPAQAPQPLEEVARHARVPPIVRLRSLVRPLVDGLERRRRRHGAACSLADASVHDDRS